MEKEINPPAEVPTKNLGNRFKPGQSGNPAGKPKGAVNKLTILRNKILQRSETLVLNDMEDILKAVIAQAKKGDMTAARLILDRVLPTRKAVEHYGLDDFKKAGITIVIEGAKGSETVNITPSKQPITLDNEGEDD